MFAVTPEQLTLSMSPPSIPPRVFLQRALYHQAVTVQRDFNYLVHKIAGDGDFLRETLAKTIEGIENMQAERVFGRNIWEAEWVKVAKSRTLELRTEHRRRGCDGSCLIACRFTWPWILLPLTYPY